MYSLLITIAVIAYVWLAVRLTRLLTKRVASIWAKWGMRLGSFLVFFLILQGDELAGLAYFNHLCSTEAGVKVYQTVELPAEYWDERGKPRFYDEKNGNLRLPTNSVKWEPRTEKYPLNLEKNISEMREISTGKILNERVLFTYWGGWLSRNFSPHNTATSCGSDVKAYTNYVMQIFKPATSTR